MSVTFVSSPVSMATVSPVTVSSPLYLATSSTYIPLATTTQTFYTRPRYVLDFDTGINGNHIVQKDITKMYMYKTLEKWLFRDLAYLLKYVVVENGKARVVKNKQEKDGNSVRDTSKSDNQIKADFIHDKILDESATRSVLIRVMKELGYSWVELPQKENVISDIIGRYIKRKLKKMMA